MERKAVEIDDDTPSRDSDIDGRFSRIKWMNHADGSSVRLQTYLSMSEASDKAQPGWRIARACQECRKRKIKCNGLTP